SAAASAAASASAGAISPAATVSDVASAASWSCGASAASAAIEDAGSGWVSAEKNAMLGSNADDGADAASSEIFGISLLMSATSPLSTATGVSAGTASAIRGAASIAASDG